MNIFFWGLMIGVSCYQQVYKRSYDVCMQLYEKELLTENSYLHIYGFVTLSIATLSLTKHSILVASVLYISIILFSLYLKSMLLVLLIQVWHKTKLLFPYSLQGADLNAQQLAIVSVSCFLILICRTNHEFLYMVNNSFIFCCLQHFMENMEGNDLTKQSYKFWYMGFRSILINSVII